MTRKHALIALKLLVSGGFLWWVLSRVDRAAFIDVFSGADLKLVGLAYLIHIGLFVLLWLRYATMLAALHTPLGAVRIAPSFYAGLFANNFLPTGVGGDLIRSWRLSRFGAPWDQLLSSSLVDRTIGLISIVAFGLLGLTWSEQIGLDDRARTGIYLILALIPVGIAILFWPACHRLLRRLAGPLIQFRPVQFGFSLLEQCARYRSHPGRIVAALGMTIALHSCAVLCYAALGLAMGATLSVWDYFAIVPLVLMTANLPIAVGGIGLREGVMTALLLQYGVDDSTAAAISLSYLFVLMSLSLPGGLVLLRSPVVKPDQEPSPGSD